MSGKIRGAFNDEQFEAFCQELMTLPAKDRTLEGISKLFSDRTGIYASPNAAKSFKEGPFSRYIEKLNRGRETREALVSAAGAGVHPLDAIEEAAVIELQDHLTNADQIDVDWLGKQLVKLRTSISMREESHRKQQDLERKLRETEKKIALADRQMKLRDEQIAKLQADAQERAEKNARAKEALQAVKSKGGITKETLKRIEEAASLL